MSNHRLRMFAGPNGSGKSTVFNEIRDHYKLDQGSIYLNADEIEKELVITSYSIHYTKLYDFFVLGKHI